MKNTFDEIIVLVILVNILGYLIKYILKSNGYPVYWFRKHLNDIPNLWRLFAKTKKTSDQIIYFALGSTYPILVALFIFSAFSHIKDFAPDKCKFEEQFRQSEWSGIINKKYVDWGNHNYETIEIKKDNHIQKVQNWVLFQNGNFDKIEIGDSIVKKQGLINVQLYKSGIETKLMVDYGCDKTKSL